MDTIWRVRDGFERPFSTIEELEVALLGGRGVVDKHHFYNPVYETSIHDPFLLLGMDLAVERVIRAIKKKEHILIWGDYDADGVTSSAELLLALRELGADVRVHLPHRVNDGYGINAKTLDEVTQGVSLFIAVDCGVTALEEVARLNERGIDSIIMDHHEFLSELPDALAVLHPRHPQGEYPWGHLCGAGVAWKFVHAIFIKMNVEKGREKLYLDLAALGTIADVMPLQGENRAIVQFGLQMLSMTRRPGLRNVLDSQSITGIPDVEDLAFRVIPRLNAPGRLDTALPALELLIEQDAGNASGLALALDQYNKDRQSIVRKLAKEAQAQVDISESFILVAHADWPIGVVGLLAGTLSREYGKPAFAVGSNGSHGVGSARAPKGHNVLAILRKAESSLLRLGGHAQAAGFSLDWSSLDEFRGALRESTPNAVDDESALLVDAKITSSLFSWDTAHMLGNFGPFGQDNVKPALCAERVPVLNARTIGQGDKHAKLTFDIDGRQVDGIGFGLGQEVSSLTDYADLVGSPEISRYRGQARLQVVVTAIARHGEVVMQGETEVARSQVA